MKILFQGDSITDGARLKPVEKRWDKNHQIGHSYAYIWRVADYRGGDLLKLWQGGEILHDLHTTRSRKR